MSTLPLREALEAALPERPFHVELWDGTALPSADGGPTFTLRSPEALGHLLRAPGQLGVGRAYVTGALEVDDVERALALLDTWSPPPIDMPNDPFGAPLLVLADQSLRKEPTIPLICAWLTPRP